MRIFATSLSILSLAGLGALVPTTTAQATPAPLTCSGCEPGYVYVYSDYDCEGYMGRTEGNDSNWGDSSGPFQGDDNHASSLLNMIYSGSFSVQFLNGSGTDWAGGNFCVSPGEMGIYNLSDVSFPSGYSADNAIRSHRWVYTSSCGSFLT